jgi:uncharacterized membrane protein
MSSSALRKTMLVLTAVGLCLSAYLTYVHYSGVTPPCSIKGNPCSEVQKSQYSLLIGIPVALIGLLGYIAILGSLLAPDGERARLVTMALVLGGFGFSLYLTYRELFTLHKICEWCVSSAVIMTVLACLSVWRFLRGDALLTALDDAAGQAPNDAPEPAAPLGAAHS